MAYLIHFVIRQLSIYLHILSNVELQNVELIGYAVLLIIKMFSVPNDKQAHRPAYARPFSLLLLVIVT